MKRRANLRTALLVLAPLVLLHPNAFADTPDAGFVSYIEQQVQRAIAEKRIPGCVVVIGRSDQVILQRAWGLRQIEPQEEPMTVDTVFDMASITKPTATATSIMHLVERGQVRVRDKVVDYLPEFTGEGREEVTVEQLMIHTSGLPPALPASDFEDGWAEAYKTICGTELRTKPGEAFRYSDIGFLLLGEIVTRASGTPLDEYALRNIYTPLGMASTRFNPPEAWRSRIAPTEKLDGEFLRGVVHDPRARLMGGVAGHAGLFSSASDLTKYAQAMIKTHRGDSDPVLMPRTLRLMTRSRSASENLRGLGWDKQSVYSRNRGETLSGSAFGHGGFTGTAMWIDPELDLFVIFLSNRLHPTGKGEANDLAGRIATIAGAACSAGSTESLASRKATLPTRLGVEALLENDCRQLHGKRIALVANHTSRNSAGESTIDLLADHPQVELVCLFSPEHGITGKLDQPEIGDTKEDSTGLPVRSLYGKTRKPSAEQLEDIDAIVFDIQDIGCRFYTYISTLGLVLEAAAENDVEVVVLDRPNPLGGDRVEGPVLDEGSESFVGFHTIPVRHGMTVGELAQMMNAERGYGAKLHVVKLANWRRDALLFDTGLPWINTSPNMRSLTQAMLYPGVGLYETTNVSVGRGTDTPFEVLGAPWIDGRLAQAIESHAPPGVEVMPIWFTPNASKHNGELCGGVRFTITDWDAFRPMDLGWSIGLALRELYGQQWDHSRFPRLLCNESVKDGVLACKSVANIREDYQPPLQEFLIRRQKFLIY